MTGAFTFQHLSRSDLVALRMCRLAEAENAIVELRQAAVTEDKIAAAADLLGRVREVDEALAARQPRVIDIRTPDSAADRTFGQ